MGEVEDRINEFAEVLKERCEIAQRFAKDCSSSSGRTLFVLEEKCKNLDMTEAIKTYFVLRETGYSVDNSIRYTVKFYEDIGKLTISLPKEKVERMIHGSYETRAGRGIPALRAYFELRRTRPDRTEDGIRSAISIILSPKETRPVNPEMKKKREMYKIRRYFLKIIRNRTSTLEHKNN